MKIRTKYILLILATTAFMLSIYNHNNELTGTSFDSVELKYAKRFFGIGIFCAVLYFFNKTWRNLLTKIMLGAFGVCLALNLYLFPQVYEGVRINEIYAEYSELETCEEMEERFATDLKNGKIKYFSFGMVSDEVFKKNMKSEFGIENFNLGCTVYSEYICYNKLVEKHIEKNYAKSINKLTE